MPHINISVGTINTMPMMKCFLELEMDIYCREKYNCNSKVNR